MHIDSTVNLFKALGDETRLKIILSLQGTEKTGCEIRRELEITQSNLSHQMKKLEDVNIIVSRKNGRFTYYSISPTLQKNISSIRNYITNPKSDVYFAPGNPRPIQKKN